GSLHGARPALPAGAAAGDPAAGGEADAAADGWVHGADRQDDLGGVADRAHRTGARGNADQHRDLPAGDGLRHGVADLLHAVLAAVALCRPPRAQAGGRAVADAEEAPGDGIVGQLSLPSWFDRLTMRALGPMGPSPRRRGG